MDRPLQASQWFQRPGKNGYELQMFWITWHTPSVPLFRTHGTKHTSGCGTTWSPSSPVCLWRARKKASLASLTPSMLSWWRARWTSTTAASTVTSRRSEDCSTQRDMALACLLVSCSFKSNPSVFLNLRSKLLITCCKYSYRQTWVCRRLTVESFGYAQAN